MADLYSLVDFAVVVAVRVFLAVLLLWVPVFVVHDNRADGLLRMLSSTTVVSVLFSKI